MALAGVTAPGNWIETIVPCGTQATCSAIVLVTAWFPLKSSLVVPGGTVTASITFKAPATAGTLAFPLVGIGNGVFTVNGPTPSITVLDASATILGVSVSPAAPAADVTAGAPATVTVRTVNDTNPASPVSVPFKGGPITFSLKTDDGGASLAGRPFTSAGSGAPFTVTTDSLPASPSGVVTLPITLTKALRVTAGGQTLTATTGTLTGTSVPFAVAGGSVPASLVIGSVNATTGFVDSSVNPIHDTSQTPALPNPAAGQAFAVDVALLDQYGNVSPTAGTPVSLATTGTVTGVLASPGAVTGADGTAEVPATYSVAANPLGLRATAGSFTADGSTPITNTGVVATLTPGVPAVVTAGGSTANLPQGANGPVALFSQPCAQADPTCTQATEITLDADFKDPRSPTNANLYSFAAPASLSVPCGGGCAHADTNEPFLTYPSYPGNTPVLGGTFSQADVNEFEQVEDFGRWPLEVALKNAQGVYPTDANGHIIFTIAPPCVDLTPANVAKTGTIASAAAQAAGFCVDVYAMSRTGGTFTGDLVRPILFVEDIKSRVP